MKWKPIFVLLEIVYSGFAGLGALYVFGSSHVLGLTALFLAVVGTAVCQELRECNARRQGMRAMFDILVGPGHGSRVGDQEQQKGCDTDLEAGGVVSPVSGAVAAPQQS